MEKVFYIVERHIRADRSEHDIALIDGVHGKLYASYEAAKQAIIKELVPHSEDCKGPSHRTTEHVDLLYGGFATGYDASELWRITTTDKNDYNVEYFIKEAKVASE